MFCAVNTCIKRLTVISGHLQVWLLVATVTMETEMLGTVVLARYWLLPHCDDWSFSQP